MLIHVSPVGVSTGFYLCVPVWNAGCAWRSVSMSSGVRVWRVTLCARWYWTPGYPHEVCVRLCGALLLICLHSCILCVSGTERTIRTNLAPVNNGPEQCVALGHQ